MIIKSEIIWIKRKDCISYFKIRVAKFNRMCVKVSFAIPVYYRKISAL